MIFRLARAALEDVTPLASDEGDDREVGPPSAEVSGVDADLKRGNRGAWLSAAGVVGVDVGLMGVDVHTGLISAGVVEVGVTGTVEEAGLGGVTGDTGLSAARVAGKEATDGLTGVVAA